MKIFINQLLIDQEFDSYFVVSSCTLRKTKTDKDYLAMVLSDKSGEMETRVWSATPDMAAEFLPGTIVKVRARVEEYRGQSQLSASQIRVAFPSEYEVGDFYRKTEKDVDGMWSDLRNILRAHVETEPLYQLVDVLLTENEEQFKVAPAAKSKHHCFIGGLLEHTLSLAEAGVLVGTHYKLRTELMVTTAILHDIGKVTELSYGGGVTSYSLSGSLLGHISIGMEMIADAIRGIPEFPARLKIEVLHMVASHHGLLEYGSPKVPLMREAICFHLLDMMDSKLELCTEVLRNDRNPGEFTAWNSDFNGPLYRGEI